MTPLRHLIAFVLVSNLLTGCTVVKEFFALLGPPETSTPRSQMRASVLERIIPPVRRDLERLASEPNKTILAAHGEVETVPAQFKRRLAIQTLKQPWEGLRELERQGLLIADMAEGGAVNLPALLDVLEAGMDRTSEFHKAIPLPTNAVAKDLVAFMAASLEQASLHRDKALTNLTEEERQFLFQHAVSLVDNYNPQVSSLSDQTIPQVKANLRFAELLTEQVDYADLIAAAQVLARLATEHWLRQLADAFPKALPATQIPPGVTGNVVLVEKTSYGLIVVGGTGPNTYELDERFALVIDLGGNDLYRGSIAASASDQQGNAVVIDLSGDDTYTGSPLGLATGRLGVGLLIDHAGDDVYQLDEGSGGTGFGGLGILFDAKGNDVYMGNRLTQGAAIGGLGLLLDGSGNDRYTSHGFAIGFGGPLGVGAVIDVLGDDHYQCGDKIPSAYNASDAPHGKPGDPMFQYDCFGLGTGAGSRVVSKRPEWQTSNLAGGWGILIDIAGHDHYDSANFSQGHGYFFGVGMKLDLNGNDAHQAARYGHGASAHYGTALFIDWDGDDRYESTGPFYNGGVAWDNSVSLMIDGGKGRDAYAFEHSTGLGRADYMGWAVFIDEGGADFYHSQSGFGDTSEQSLAGFFDLNGKDTYTLPSDYAPSAGQRPQNGIVFVYPKGGVFHDYD